MNRQNILLLLACIAAGAVIGAILAFGIILPVQRDLTHKTFVIGCLLRGDDKPTCERLAVENGYPE